MHRQWSNKRKYILWIGKAISVDIGVASVVPGGWPVFVKVNSLLIKALTIEVSSA